MCERFLTLPISSICIGILSLFGCSQQEICHGNESERQLVGLIEEIEQLPKELRGAFTLKKWITLGELFEHGVQSNPPADFPMVPDNNRHEVTTVFRLRSDEWRILPNNYFIVKGYPLTGPSVSQLALYQRKTNGSWREIVYLHDYSALWHEGLGFNDYNLPSNNEWSAEKSCLDEANPALPSIRSKLLDLTLYWFETHKDSSGGLNFNTHTTEDVREYVVRLFHWGVHLVDGPYGINTNNDFLNILFTEPQERIVCEWSRVRNNFFVARIHASYETGSSMTSYAILERKEDGIYHCLARVTYEYTSR